MSTPTFDLRSVFFGTPAFAVAVLDELEAAGIIPTLIVTAPDAPQGRGMRRASPPVKEWADTRGIDVLQPETLKDSVFVGELQNTEWDLFMVAAYGMVMPKSILDIPLHGTLNVHPSLLPKFRGASPIRAAILANEHETGVTIMQMDEKLDHGPIVSAARIELDPWPQPARLLEDLFAHEGGALLAETIPLWVTGDITPEPQNDTEASVCGKIKKEDGLIEIDGEPYQNYLKYCAYDGWPGTYFFVERNGTRMRVKITAASYDAAENTFVIERVIPEGKREMAYADFIR